MVKDRFSRDTQEGRKDRAQREIETKGGISIMDGEEGLDENSRQCRR